MSLFPVLDFDVLPTYDSKVLWVLDTSEWKHLEDIEAYLDITTPARKESVTLIFDKHTQIRINSANLELSCADCDDDLVSLPDGLYHIKLSICNSEDYVVEKYYLRTVKLKLELGEILMGMELSSCSVSTDMLDRFSEIEMLLKGAHAHVRAGNINEGMIIYNKTLDLLKKLRLCADATNQRSL